jgi:hypothetical protein
MMTLVDESEWIEKGFQNRSGKIAPKFTVLNNLQIILMKDDYSFCGSSAGSDGTLMEQATLLGQTLAKQKIQVVYGGSNVGLIEL